MEVFDVSEVKKNPAAVLLVWSMPDEVSFVTSVRARYGRIAVCPLRLTALHAARRLFSPDEILDPADVFSVEERLKVFDEATAAFNRFIAYFRGKEPWFDGAEIDTSGPLFYYFYLWRKLIGNLDAKFGKPRLLHYGLFSKLSMIGLYTQIDDLLARQVAHHEHPAAPDSRLRRFLNGFNDALGGFVNASPGLFAEEAVKVEVPESKLVLASPAEGDRWVQVEYARRLAARGVPFRLLATGESKALRSSDEKVFGKDADSFARSTTDLPPQWRLHRWRRGPWQRLHGRHVHKVFHEALCATGAPDVPRDEWLILSDFLVRANGERVLDYQSVKSVLERAKPETVVVQSGTYTTPLVSVWCERNRVKTVRLPHGFEYGMWHGYWRGDVFGVMGRHGQRELETEKVPSPPKRYAHVGGVHVVDMVRRARPTATQVQRRALLIHSGSMVIRPDCDSEQERYILDLAEHLSAAGVPLLIRFHPRQEFILKPDHALIAEVGAKRGIKFEVADSSESLTQQIANSAVAINQTWSGACVAALYERVPLIAWKPAPHIKPYAMTQAMLPLRGASGAEVAALAKRLCDDEAFRAESLRAQEEVFADVIENPRGDPYERSVELILKEAGIQ